MAKSSSVKVAAFIFIIFASQVAMAYQNGSAPWCRSDDSGNLQCYFWQRSACVNSVDMSQSDDTCIRNQNTGGGSVFGGSGFNLNANSVPNNFVGGVNPTTGQTLGDVMENQRLQQAYQAQLIAQAVQRTRQERIRTQEAQMELDARNASGN